MEVDATHVFFSASFLEHLFANTQIDATITETNSSSNDTGYANVVSLVTVIYLRQYANMTIQPGLNLNIQPILWPIMLTTLWTL